MKTSVIKTTLLLCVYAALLTSTATAAGTAVSKCGPDIKSWGKLTFKTQTAKIEMEEDAKKTTDAQKLNAPTGVQILKQRKLKFNFDLEMQPCIDHKKQLHIDIHKSLIPVTGTTSDTTCTDKKCLPRKFCDEKKKFSRYDDTIPFKLHKKRLPELQDGKQIVTVNGHLQFHGTDEALFKDLVGWTGSDTSKFVFCVRIEVSRDQSGTSNKFLVHSVEKLFEVTLEKENVHHPQKQLSESVVLVNPKRSGFN